jgi:hypothetical protein
MRGTGALAQTLLINDSPTANVIEGRISDKVRFGVPRQIEAMSETS